ncbi:MAG: sigma-54 dependent transcriptional regulator [Gemmatimonadota bacterium]
MDDDPTMRDVLEMRLQEWGFQVILAENGRQAAELVTRHDPDLVLSDVVMPDMSGLDLLRELQGTDPHRPVVLLTAHGTVEVSVEAMKAGAVDFLTKPLDYRNLKAVLDQAVRDRTTRRKAQAFQCAPGEAGAPVPGIVGKSAVMEEVFQLIRSVAGSDTSVFITGESGSGKELVARAIHDLGSRSRKPFVAVNAAAIPRELVESELFGHEKGAFTGASAQRPGCFELAHEGTLFLDEIGEMPMELQPKLLRVLEEARFRRVGGGRELEVDVRVLAATNRDPREAVKSGELREDLYYRLNVFTIPLPPLRTRTGDISVLALSFLEGLARKHGSPAAAIRDEALALLEAYRWPGNVRELRNVMERAVVLAGQGEWIESTHLPPYIREREPEEGDDDPLPSGLTVAEMERRLILQTLNETDNNKSEAARRLGLNVRTIRNKLKSYGVDD